MKHLESDRDIPETCFFLDYENDQDKRSIFIFEVVDGQVLSATGFKTVKYRDEPFNVRPSIGVDCNYPLTSYCETFGGCENTSWFELTDDELMKQIILEVI